MAAWSFQYACNHWARVGVWNKLIWAIVQKVLKQNWHVFRGKRLLDWFKFKFVLKDFLK